jgi:hypothetical protein
MKVAFWVVFAAGFAACTALGIGPVLKRMGGDWLSVPMLAGMVLGAVILIVAAAFVAGVRPAFLPSDAAMLAALVTLIGVKVLVGALAMSGVLGKA